MMDFSLFIRASMTSLDIFKEPLGQLSAEFVDIF